MQNNLFLGFSQARLSMQSIVGKRSSQRLDDRGYTFALQRVHDFCTTPKDGPQDSSLIMALEKLQMEHVALGNPIRLLSCAPSYPVLGLGEITVGGD